MFAQFFNAFTFIIKQNAKKYRFNIVYIHSSLKH